MEPAIGTFGGRVPVALPEGRFPVDKGSPPGFARIGRTNDIMSISCPENLNSSGC